MSRVSLRRIGLRRMRSWLGRSSGTEQAVRSARNAVKYRLGKSVTRRDFYASRGNGSDRFGLYGIGGCDVLTVVKAGPRLAKLFPGSVCVTAVGKAPQTRSDLLLQTLDPPSPELTAEVMERLSLDPAYFTPRLFEREFSVPHQAGLGRFPKNVVVLSISADASRTLYRHREHGYLVDPGGWWLTTDMQAVLNDLSSVKWFAATFKKVGRIGVAESMDNFAKLVTLVRQRTGAFVIAMNVLTVDPGLTAMDYDPIGGPPRARRREFAIAMAELGRTLEFPVIDIDRLAKQEGISGQADFVHYTLDQKRLVAQELVDVLQDHEIIGAAAGRRQPAGVA